MLHPNSAQGQRHIWCYIGTFPFSQHKLYGFYLQFEFSVHKMIKKTAWNTKWGDSLTFCFASHVPYMVIMTLLFIIMEGVILLVDSQLGIFCHHCLNISDMVTYIYAVYWMAMVTADHVVITLLNLNTFILCWSTLICPVYDYLWNFLTSFNLNSH